MSILQEIRDAYQLGDMSQVDANGDEAHWIGCYSTHLLCAIRMLLHLVDDRNREIERLRNLINEWADNHDDGGYDSHEEAVTALRKAVGR